MAEKPRATRQTPRAQSAKQRPTYAVQSVDNALRLAAMLQSEGEITVTEAARRLDVAPSTAHRLLGMLVYRDFAAHSSGRGYRAGPVLSGQWPSRTRLARLREMAEPHMELLALTLRETCNLSFRVGAHIRFLVSAVGPDPATRISSREGMSFPLDRTSGGLQLLAGMTDEQIETLYDPVHFEGHEDERPDMRALMRSVRAVRGSGVALNIERSEAGLAAIGRPLRDLDDRVVASIGVSMPLSHFDERRIPTTVAVLDRTAEAIRTDLLIREIE